jgi:hypothetical protein
VEWREIMVGYIPEYLNEVCRIVVTTRNDNPSVEEYDTKVLPEWRRCQEIQTAVREAKRIPTPQELAEVTRRVLAILRAKRVPESEISERLNEAFERCKQGVYPVERRQIESLLLQSA